MRTAILLLLIVTPVSLGWITLKDDIQRRDALIKTHTDTLAKELLLYNASDTENRTESLIDARDIEEIIQKIEQRVFWHFAQYLSLLNLTNVEFKGLGEIGDKLFFAEPAHDKNETEHKKHKKHHRRFLSAGDVLVQNLRRLGPDENPNVSITLDKEAQTRSMRDFFHTHVMPANNRMVYHGRALLEEEAKTIPLKPGVYAPTTTNTPPLESLLPAQYPPVTTTPPSTPRNEKVHNAVYDETTAIARNEPHRRLLSDVEQTIIKKQNSTRRDLPQHKQASGCTLGFMCSFWDSLNESIDKLTKMAHTG